MGRPRKAGVRRDTTTGRSRGDDARGVVIAYRAREVGPTHAADPLAGYTLGRLHLKGDITRDQLDTGNSFADLIKNHAALHGYQIDKLNSPGFEMVSYGISCAAETDAEKSDAIRRNFKEAYAALVKKGVGGIGIATITYDACLERLAGRPLTTVQLKMIILGLDILIGIRK